MLAAAVDGCARGRRCVKICLDEDLPPLSVHHRGKPDSGFDVALAQAIAERLGRPLKIQWFESKLDEGFEPGARGQCAAVRRPLLAGRRLCADNGFPGQPGIKTAKLPDFEGATRAIAAAACRSACSRRASPSLFAADGRAWAEGARPQIAGIGDLAGLRIGIESGTLADAILMTFDKGRLIDNITHLVPGRDDLLGALDRGDSRRDAARSAPVRRLSRRASGHQARRLRILLSDRRQSRLCRPRQRSGAARRRQQGAVRSCRPRARSPSSPRRPASPICRRANRRSLATSGRRSFSGEASVGPLAPLSAVMPACAQLRTGRTQYAEASQSISAVSAYWIARSAGR